LRGVFRRRGLENLVFNGGPWGRFFGGIFGKGGGENFILGGAPLGVSGLKKERGK